MALFQHTICDWDSWEAVYQDADAWKSLVMYILAREGLPTGELELLPPGTNAVFGVGDMVVKIFAPDESRSAWEGYGEAKYQAEVFGLRRAESAGIRAPRVYVTGVVEDAYRFRYLVMERVWGERFEEATKQFDDTQKRAVGRQLRAMADALNSSCEDWGSMDVVARARDSRQWDEFPPSFQAERLAYLEMLPSRERVYVHGDMHAENLLVAADGEIILLDFADSVIQ